MIAAKLRQYEGSEVIAEEVSDPLYEDAAAATDSLDG